MNPVVALIFIVTLCFAVPAAHATAVRVDTPLGSFYVDLLEDEAPATVANFLAYLRDGSYDNAVIHRSSHGFVIQGGGFTFSNDEFTRIAERAPVVNEFGVSNTRGTMAMAKLPDNPDSATSQWFINADDNSENLDNQNGGFTVFGRVLGDGMTVVDLINSVVRFNLDPDSFTEIPLILMGAISSVSADNVVFTRITEVTAFEINAGLSGAWFNPATPGQGWLIDVIDNGDRSELFIAWFTWDIAAAGKGGEGFASTDNRWLTASGSFDGASASLTLARSTGGVFNDPQATGLETVGTLGVEFLDCTNARITWDFDDPEIPDDAVDVIRLSPDAFCTGLALPAE